MQKQTKLKSIAIVIGTILCLSLIVPLVLNIILQYPNPTTIEIINEDSKTAKVWLIFWSAYLSAIGTIVLAVVSYLQNKEALRENRIQFHFESDFRRYENLERFVKYSCELHSSIRIGEIIHLLQHGEKLKALDKCERYLFDLYFVTHAICHYKQLFSMQPMADFGNELAKENLKFITLTQDLLHYIYEYTNKRYQVNYSDEFIKYKILHKNVLGYFFIDAIEISNLQQKGYNLLKQEITRITNQYNQ